MLERAKEVTRSGWNTRLEYARFADDDVVEAGNGAMGRIEAPAIGESRRQWLLPVS